MKKVVRNSSYSVNSSAFNKALKYLSLRPRSVKEINDYLIKKGFSSDEINKAVKKLLDLKFLDDKEFAKVFTNSKQIRGKSKRNISFDLKLKGINRELAEQALSGAKEDIEVAKEYIEKRLHQFEKLTPENKRQRIINRLRLRGYSWDVIKEVLKKS